MQMLTPENWVPHHKLVLTRLCTLAQTVGGVRTHPAGMGYTSLMSSFLMHNVSGARSLLSWLDFSGAEWFPVTHGFAVARTMFETDVTAHYITKSPHERTRQYILFEHVLKKRAMDACRKHRESADPSWRDAMEVEWQGVWSEREQDIEAKFAEVVPLFTGRNGRLHNSWSGKSIKKLAAEVDHEEAYDTFYAQLSSFTHGDVRSANRFLRFQPDGPFWTQRASTYDVGEVLHCAASFLACFLNLFGEQFATWDIAAVDTCWDAEGGPTTVSS